MNTWQINVTLSGLATAPDGSILVGDYGAFAVDRIVNNQLTVLTKVQAQFTGRTGWHLQAIRRSCDEYRLVYADTDGVNAGTDQPAVAAISPKGQAQLLTTGTDTSP